MADPKEEPSKTVEPAGGDVDQKPSARHDGGGGYNGRGRGGGRGRGRGRGSWNRGDNGHGTTQPHASRTKWKGATTAIESHVFDRSSAYSIDAYNKTMSALADHVGSTYKSGGHIRTLIETLVKPVVTVADYPDNGTPTEKKLWEKRVDIALKKEQQLEDNIENLFSVVLGQCTPTMKAKLEGRADFDAMKTSFDVVVLFKAIRETTYKFEAHRNPYLSMFNTKSQMSNLRQAEHVSNAEYLETFRNMVSTLEVLGGNIWSDTTLIQGELTAIDETKLVATELAAGGSADLDAATTACREKMLAMYFLMGADPKRFAILRRELENDQTMGQNHYPDTVTDAYNLLVHYSTSALKRRSISEGTGG
jgi:hypothetical protein